MVGFSKPKRNVCARKFAEFCELHTPTASEPCHSVLKAQHLIIIKSRFYGIYCHFYEAFSVVILLDTATTFAQVLRNTSDNVVKVEACFKVMLIHRSCSLLCRFGRCKHNSVAYTSARIPRERVETQCCVEIFTEKTSLRYRSWASRSGFCETDKTYFVDLISRFLLLFCSVVSLCGSSFSSTFQGATDTMCRHVWEFCCYSFFHITAFSSLLLFRLGDCLCVTCSVVLFGV